MIFLLNQCHSNVEKSGGQTIGQNNRKSYVFCMISTTCDEQQNLGMEGQVALFYSKTLQVSGKLKHKLQAAVPVMYWYFFNLNEITVVKKEKCMIRIFISSFER